MLETLCEYSQRQRLHFRDGLRSVDSVAHHAGKIRDLGDPPTIRLTFELDIEGHVTYSSIGFAAQQGLPYS